MAVAGDGARLTLTWGSCLYTRRRTAASLAILWLAGLVSPAFAVALETEISTTGFTSARVCGECHVGIYDSWKNSLHGFSVTDPIFDTAFMQALKEGGDEARRVCLSCHAPMVLVNEDFTLQQGVTREGVSCDFCRSVAASLSYQYSPTILRRQEIDVQLGQVERIVY